MADGMSASGAWWAVPVTATGAEAPAGAVTGTEVRVVDAETGGAKGAKPEDFALIPWDALREVARAYHYGGVKYADPEVGKHNWRRGYAYSLNFASLIRHASAWWEGEDRDPESGLHHLAHAAWHCLCLIWFQLHGKGRDDRPSVLFAGKR